MVAKPGRDGRVYSSRAGPVPRPLLPGVAFPNGTREDYQTISTTAALSGSEPFNSVCQGILGLWDLNEESSYESQQNSKYRCTNVRWRVGQDFC